MLKMYQFLLGLLLRTSILLALVLLLMSLVKLFMRMVWQQS